MRIHTPFLSLFLWKEALPPQEISRSQLCKNYMIIVLKLLSLYFFAPIQKLFIVFGFFSWVIKSFMNRVIFFLWFIVFLRFCSHCKVYRLLFNVKVLYASFLPSNVYNLQVTFPQKIQLPCDLSLPQKHFTQTQNMLLQRRQQWSHKYFRCFAKYWCRKKSRQFLLKVVFNWASD